MANRRRLASVMAAGLVVMSTLGCHAFGSGPNDQEVAAAVSKSPPSPPTAGPTYLAEIQSVEVQERGRYNSDGKYWPVRIRVKGGIRIEAKHVFQLTLLGNPEKQPPRPVDFVEEARLTKDDFGNWRASYTYDPTGPRWRLEPSSTVR